MKQAAQLTKGERTRRKILDAAKRLFLMQGYAATSMRQIAQEVGITPAAIYIHFSGKEQVFSTLLEEVAPFDALVNLFETVEGETPEALIENIFHNTMDLLYRREDYIRLAIIDVLEREGKSYRVFLPRFFPHVLAFHQRVVALDEGQGRLREVSPFVFLRALVSLIIGYLMTEWVARPTQTLPLPTIDWQQGLTDIFLHGVLKSTQLEKG
jgi:AcrR family transcriptional regulator